MNLETPCLVVDEAIMKRNIARMAEVAAKNGCKLRPHTKTHKIPAIARLQVAAGADGITVAKVGEAEVMAEQGLSDIFIAYPVIGTGKIARVLALNRRIRLIVGVDSIAGATALSEAALADGQTIEVRLEVDTGMHRTGVGYEQALEFAKTLAGFSGIRLTGIFTFKGLIYEGKATLDREKAGLEEGRLLVDLAEKLRQAGIAIRDVSVGSTPTAAYAAQVPGVTEIRPGTYVFNDTMLANLGVCSPEDCALSVLTTVVSRAADYAVVDGGNKTFSTDAAQGVFPYYLKGYGRTVGDDQLILERLSEEHGIVSILPGAGEIRVGDVLAIIPNHVCTTVNLHDKLYLRRDGRIVGEAAIAGRGKVS
ncbi:D-serine deaminase-like pyridoxal phosphate-dependent protein [Hydrogenispora ethanolica]|uniref:D-serine deaminase-like pyridoxal phosphate-dependent protein n=1 Tax=Hydrogenispora ethanolica TaxID=1082276 RepID=A0A4V2QF08_HYDET|nr:alanine racemase [Hydrogenispora ethanolica]TCL70087.1 D-serine deaminase-like pyridoxal phosphate-dependent protein [Hydrogenispora ethanolica]